VGDWWPQIDLAGLEIMLIVSTVSGDDNHDNRDNPSDGESRFPIRSLDCLDLILKSVDSHGGISDSRVSK
jgi:hypothetical protein